MGRLESVVLRALGWTAWAGHSTLAGILLAASAGAARLSGLPEVVLAALLAAVIPTFVMISHLKENPVLHEQDRQLWRVLLLWGGPVAGAVYLTSRDRRISLSPVAWMLRSFLD